MELDHSCVVIQKSGTLVLNPESHIPLRGLEAFLCPSPPSSPPDLDSGRDTKKASSKGAGFLTVVGHTGFEPVTSALSRQRSKPTELMTRTGQM